MTSKTRAGESTASPTVEPWLEKPQRKLGTGGFVAYLALANILVPFSVDIYTPSLPEMPAQFGTTESMVSLTLALFYLFFAIALLVFGAASDRTGRKPMLVAGSIVYTAGSAACALSGSIEMLIGARIVQALGAGAVYATATALVSDCFSPARRGTVLTLMQVLFVVGPVVAPLVGGVVIQYGTWREVFAVLGVLGALCLVGTLLFEESRAGTRSENEPRSLLPVSGIKAVLKDSRFVVVLAVMSLFNLMFMAYVAAGSYVYVGEFGMTQQEFTYFFAATAAIAALGPIVRHKFGKNARIGKLGVIAIVASLAAGAAIVLSGNASAWLFTALCVVFCSATMTFRPLTIALMLQFAEDEAGAASSVLNFVSTVLGAAGMVAVMAFGDLTRGLGITVIASMAASIVLWLAYLKMRKSGADSPAGQASES